MRYPRGFTLIELLVVIAIIGVLSSIIVASLNTARFKALDAQRESNMQSIQQALELYATDHGGKYPFGGGGADAWTGQCEYWGSFAANNVITGLVPTYIGTFPQDPSMIVAVDQNCILYISNGTDYKLLDYNMTNSPNPGGPKSLVDPARNYGQPYARPAGCSTTDPTITWAIYTNGKICS